MEPSGRKHPQMTADRRHARAARLRVWPPPSVASGCGRSGMVRRRRFGLLDPRTCCQFLATFRVNKGSTGWPNRARSHRNRFRLAVRARDHTREHANPAASTFNRKVQARSLPGPSLRHSNNGSSADTTETRSSLPRVRVRNSRSLPDVESSRSPNSRAGELLAPARSECSDAWRRERA
jgi:hypothetical protein